jgi:hypothetical protein
MFFTALNTAILDFDAPRITALLTTVPPSPVRLGIHAYSTLFNAIDSAQELPTPIDSKRIAACLNAVVSVIDAYPTGAFIEFGPSPLAFLLDQAQTDPRREWRPIWADSFRRIAATHTPSAALARSQLWLMNAPPTIAPADLRSRPPAALEALFWSRRHGPMPPPTTVLAKLRAVVGAYPTGLDPMVSDILLCYALAYVIRHERNRHTLAEEDEEHCIAIVRTTIEDLGADPTICGGSRIEPVVPTNLYTLFPNGFSLSAQWAFWTTRPAPHSRNQERSRARCTPIYRLLHSADIDARDRALAVAMALHPRSRSPLAALEPQMFREWLVPAARRSVALEPVTSYENTLRRRLRAEANVDMYRAKRRNGGVLRLFEATVQSRAKLTPRLLARFRALGWQVGVMPNELARKATAVRNILRAAVPSMEPRVRSTRIVRALRKCVRARGPPRRN